MLLVIKTKQNVPHDYKRSIIFDRLVILLKNCLELRFKSKQWRAQVILTFVDYLLKQTYAYAYCQTRNCEQNDQHLHCQHMKKRHNLLQSLGRKMHSTGKR
jgi:hypothetical protein